MALAHPLSAQGENSSLQLFQVPVTDMSIIGSKWVDHEPVQSGTNPMEFVIKPLTNCIDIYSNSGQDYQTRWVGSGCWKKVHSNHSIIKQFTIKINRTLVTEQSAFNAYNAYFKTLLNYTEQAKKSYLIKALCCKDTSLHMEEVDNTTDNNEGIKKRAAFTNKRAEWG